MECGARLFVTDKIDHFIYAAFFSHLTEIRAPLIPLFVSVDKVRFEMSNKLPQEALFLITCPKLHKLLKGLQRLQAVHVCNKTLSKPNGITKIQEISCSFPHSRVPSFAYFLPITSIDLLNLCVETFSLHYIKRFRLFSDHYLANWIPISTTRITSLLRHWIHKLNLVFYRVQQA